MVGRRTKQGRIVSGYMPKAMDLHIEPFQTRNCRLILARLMQVESKTTGNTDPFVTL